MAMRLARARAASIRARRLVEAGGKQMRKPPRGAEALRGDRTMVGKLETTTSSPGERRSRARGGESNGDGRQQKQSSRDRRARRPRPRTARRAAGADSYRDPKQSAKRLPRTGAQGRESARRGAEPLEGTAVAVKTCRARRVAAAPAGRGEVAHDVVEGATLMLATHGRCAQVPSSHE